MSIYHNYAPITTKDLTVEIYLTESFNYTGFMSVLERKIIEIQRKYKNKIAFQTDVAPPGNTTYGLLFFAVKMATKPNVQIFIHFNRRIFKGKPK